MIKVNHQISQVCFINYLDFIIIVFLNNSLASLLYWKVNQTLLICHANINKRFANNWNSIKDCPRIIIVISKWMLFRTFLSKGLRSRLTILKWWVRIFDRSNIRLSLAPYVFTLNQELIIKLCCSFWADYKSKIGWSIEIQNYYKSRYKLT